MTTTIIYRITDAQGNLVDEARTQDEAAKKLRPGLISTPFGDISVLATSFMDDGTPIPGRDHRPAYLRDGSNQ